MDTLSEGIRKLREYGFPTDFMVKANQLSDPGRDRFYSPEEVKLLCHFRFEGKSDPDDMSIVYGLETKDGIRGIVVNAYGAYADKDISGFMTKVEAEKFDYGSSR